jgi:anion-transporting  ArsA/GET3 family ATPase
MSATFIDPLVRERRIIVCVGAGGVGKTTTAAALGVAAAMAGRRTVLLTIDPANRLADALGLPALGGSPVPVPLGTVSSAPQGRLDALRLDTRATFDGLVTRLAPSPAAAEAVRANRLYENVAGRLAASESYMAVEKLYELATEDPPDLIVLDTPPTEHALDFLDAPERIVGVLNSRALTILQNPASVLTSAGSRVSQMILGVVIRALEQFTGLTLLRDIADFVTAFDGMIDGLRDRAVRVAEQLRAPTTAFVMVTAPNGFAVGRAESFYRTLASARVPCAGLIVNRVLPRALFEREPPAADGATPADLPPEIVQKLVRAFGDLRALAQDEYASIARLRQRLGLGERLVEIPAFPGDLASIADVARFARLLTNGGLGNGAPARMSEPRGERDVDSSAF